MRRAPGRGIWCLDQSNTNTGHDIPSGHLDAPEHCTAGLNRLPKLREFDSEEAQDTGLEGWSRPGLRGVELRRYRRRLWGLTRQPIPGLAHA